MYYPSLHFGFVNFDEPVVLLSHPNLYNERSVISSLQEILFNYFPREEPLIIRDISWAIDSRLFGFKNPFGYHFGNVVLNSCNVALLFLFLFLTTARFGVSLLVTAAFAVLPVHVEPICWIMGRKDMLVTFFMLIALNIQTIYLKTTDPQNKRLCWLATLLATLAALLSKINAVTFFAVLAAADMSTLSSSKKKNRLSSLTPWIPHALISVFMFGWYKNIISAWGVISTGFSVENLLQVFIMVPLVIGFYLKLIFWHSEYSLYYPLTSFLSLSKSAQLSLSIGILLAFGGIFLMCYRSRKELWFYGAAFVILMIPYFNIIGVGIWAANRYIYFSSFCVLALAAERMLSVKSNYLRTAMGMLWVGFILISGVQTWKHQQVWRNDRALWTYETSLKDPWILSFVYLANSYIDAGLSDPTPDAKTQWYDHAERILQNSLKRFEHSGHPAYYQFFYVSGVLAQLKEEPLHHQLTFFQEAYKLCADDPDVVNKLADVFRRLALQASDVSERERLALQSLQYFEQYLQRVENDPPVHYRSLSILEEYEIQFPFLTDRIRQSKAAIAEKLNKGIRK